VTTNQTYGRLLLASLAAIVLFDGVFLGVLHASLQVRMLVETRCPQGGADEEHKGSASTAAMLQAEFVPAPNARSGAGRAVARQSSPLSPSFALSGARRPQCLGAPLGFTDARAISLKSAVLRV
jgi:hypothetical protein